MWIYEHFKYKRTCADVSSGALILKWLIEHSFKTSSFVYEVEKQFDKIKVIACILLIVKINFILPIGKFVPEDAVKEMKANYVLPSEGEPFIDEIMWVELPREQAVPLIQKWVFIYKYKKITI